MLMIQGNKIMSLGLSFHSFFSRNGSENTHLSTFSRSEIGKNFREFSRHEILAGDWAGPRPKLTNFVLNILFWACDRATDVYLEENENQSTNGGYLQNWNSNFT